MLRRPRAHPRNRVHNHRAFQVNRQRARQLDNPAHRHQVLPVNRQSACRPAFRERHPALQQQLLRERV
jgi:hypothetical protein